MDHVALKVKRALPPKNGYSTSEKIAMTAHLKGMLFDQLPFRNRGSACFATECLKGGLRIGLFFWERNEAVTLRLIAFAVYDHEDDSE